MDYLPIFIRSGRPGIVVGGAGGARKVECSSPRLQRDGDAPSLAESSAVVAQGAVNTSRQVLLANSCARGAPIAATDSGAVNARWRGARARACRSTWSITRKLCRVHIPAIIDRPSVASGGRSRCWCGGCAADRGAAAPKLGRWRLWASAHA